MNSFQTLSPFWAFVLFTRSFQVKEARQASSAALSTMLLYQSPPMCVYTVYIYIYKQASEAVTTVTVWPLYDHPPNRRVKASLRWVFLIGLSEGFVRAPAKTGVSDALKCYATMPQHYGRSNVKTCITCCVVLWKLAETLKRLTGAKHWAELCMSTKWLIISISALLRFWHYTFTGTMPTCCLLPQTETAASIYT